MIMLNKKITNHHYVIYVKKLMKQSFMLFMNVKLEKKIWKTFEPLIKKLNRKAENNPLQNILGLNAINTENKTKKLIMTINTTILNDIWKA